MDSVNDSVSKHTGFPHSAIAGYNGSYHLTDAYRRLARPSSVSYTHLFSTLRVLKAHAPSHELIILSVTG